MSILHRKNSALNQFLEPNFTSNPFLKNSPFLKNNLAKNPSPYIIQPLYEKITSFSQYSQLELKSLKTDVNEQFFNEKKADSPILRFNNIEITLENLYNFELKDVLSNKMMDFYLSYFLKLQIKENKSLFFLKLLQFSLETLEINTVQLPSAGLPNKNIYKYFFFILKIKEKWILFQYDVYKEKCDILFHPEAEIDRNELISIARKILTKNRFSCKSLLIDKTHIYDKHKDSGLAILNYLYEVYGNEKIEEIQDFSRKNEFLWVIYQMISNQHGIERKKSNGRGSQVNQIEETNENDEMLNSYKKKKKPGLNIVIPKNPKIDKIHTEKNNFFLKPNYLGNNEYYPETARNNASRGKNRKLPKNSIISSVKGTGSSMNMPASLTKIPGSLTKIPVSSIMKTPGFPKKLLNSPTKLPTIYNRKESIYTGNIKNPMKQNNSYEYEGRDNMKPNNSYATEENRTIQISRDELKGVLQSMKDEIFEELGNRDYVNKFLNNKLKNNSMPQEEMKFSKDELKKLLKNFKSGFQENIQYEAKKKQDDYIKNIMNLGLFQNLLNFYYYYSPEMYEYLTKEYSKRIGDYYLGNLFENKEQKSWFL